MYVCWNPNRDFIFYLDGEQLAHNDYGELVHTLDRRSCGFMLVHIAF